MGPLLALLSIVAGAEPALPKGWQAPEDWQVMGFANGDLNGDGRPDLAVVLRDAQDEVRVEVYLQQANGTFRLHTTSAGAACFRCGEGAKAPTVEGLPSIKKGVLELDYLNGWGQAWENVARFRLDKGGHFILVGYTYRSWDTTSAHPEQETGYASRDANLAALKMVELAGKRRVTCRLAKKLKGLELSRFEWGRFDVGHCGKM